MTVQARLLACAAVLTVAACAGGAQTAVELDDVRPGEVTQTVAAPATVQPEGQETVVAPTSGEVAEVLVRSGEVVDAGQPVLLLTSEGVDLAIAQAQAGLEAAGALASAVPSVDLAPLIAPVRRQLEGVIPPLLDTLEDQAQAIPDEQLRLRVLDDVVLARARYQQTVRDLAAAEASARSAARRASASQRAAADAQRQQAEAALAAAEARSDALTITAPMAGTVELTEAPIAELPPAAGELPPELGGLLGGNGGGAGGGPVRPGARVTVGQVLFTVYDLSGFHVRATVDEVDAVLVAEGQAATVFVDAHPDERFEGAVERIGVGPSQGASGAVVYPVRVAFATAPSVALRVGMTASIEIAVREVSSETTVPTRALLRRDGRDVILVVDGEDRVRAVEVELEAVGEERAAVDGDVEPGDRVVVGGHEELEDGDRLPR